MVLMEDCRQKLDAAQKALEMAGGYLNPEEMKRELDEIQESMGQPGFWDDVATAQKAASRASHLEQQIGKVEKLNSRAQEASEWIDMAMAEEDEALAEEVRAEVDALSAEADALYLSTLLRGEYDANNAMLSIHAGAGGTEAQDWAQMVMRMYQRYCEKHDYKVTVLDLQDGDEAGIKSCDLLIEGENAYGYLKSEKGVHRLVRISPYDASARRHTSFCSLDVMPEVAEDSEIKINPEDLRVDTYRSSGAGGQHINKTDSAIRITHLPTGIVVSCQTQRSQIQNRETAMNMLRARLAELKEREYMEKMAEVKGELKKIEWGSQIRSYVLQPYTMVNDHRTGEKTPDAQGVLDGDLDAFINAYLRMM
nr:peptide chain release factor 2 [bacterium]